MPMATAWVSEFTTNKFKVAFNSCRVFDTAILFANHLTLKESWERKHSLCVVLANGKHRFVAAGVHMPCWCSDEEFAMTAEELKTDLAQAKRKWKCSSVHIGMDANCSTSNNICTSDLVGNWSGESFVCSPHQI